MILHSLFLLHKDLDLSIKFSIYLDGLVLLRVIFNESTTVLPVTNILLEGLFSFKRLLADHSVGAKYNVLRSSIKFFREWII